MELSNCILDLICIEYFKKNIMKNIIIVTALMLTNIFYAQNSKDAQKYDIKMPEKVFLNAKKQISTSYTIEDGKTTIYFIVREVFDIPKQITTTKEFYRWYNEGRIDVAENHHALCSHPGS